MTVDVAAILAQARRPERTLPLCLRGDLVAQWEALERDLEATPEATSLAGDGRQAIAQQMQDLQEEMAASTVVFTVRALPRRRWTALVAEHPPRRDDDDVVVLSDRIGVNADTFAEVIIKECVVDPVLEPAQLATLMDEVLSSSQYDSLFDAAWGVNRRDVDVPFSRAVSTILGSSAPA